MNEEGRETGPIAGRGTTRQKSRPIAASSRGEAAASVAWLWEGQRSDWRRKPRSRERNAPFRPWGDGLSVAGSCAQRDRPRRRPIESGTASQWPEPTGRNTSSFPALHDLPHHRYGLGTIPGTRPDGSPNQRAIPRDYDRGRESAHHEGTGHFLIFIEEDRQADA
jgi:hypothetical protein